MMKEVRISDLLQIKNGYAFKSEDYQKQGIPLLRITNIENEKVHFGTGSVFLPKNFENEYSDFLVKNGDVVIALSGATTGKFGVYTLKEPSLLNQRIGLIRSDSSDRVDSTYFYYFLNQIKAEILNKAQGVAQPNISTKEIGQFQIPLPPLPVQQKIAAILDTADLHRQKTKTLIEKYDQLTQSIFLEMFGDPVRNEMGWEKVELSKLGAVVTGSTPPSSKEGMFGGEIPFVTPGDLGKNGSIKRTVTKEGAKNSRIVSNGSLLVCCIGATIGKTDIARADSAFNQQINAVDWNESIVPLYGFHSFGFLKSEVISRGISTTLPILKKSEFAKIKMAVPPLHLQKKFAQRVNLIEEQVTKTHSTILKSEELFNTLLQRAFKGELVS